MSEQAIRTIFKTYPEVLFGFARINYSPFSSDYRSALVFAVPYGRQLSIKTYREPDFEQGILEAKEVIEKILPQITAALTAGSIKYYVPPAAQRTKAELEELRAPFSFKFAAVHAGLGWIGKNDVLITEQYGPRVRLSAILIDEVFAYGEMIQECRCPASCRKCIDICPCHALRNISWNINSMRSEIIDYALCNQYRSRYLQRYGRKNACGLCMAACPFGGHSSA